MKVSRLREVLRAYHYTSGEHWSELKELERLARIGKATEKVFEDGYVLANNNGRYAECDDICTIEELIKGLESEKK